MVAQEHVPRTVPPTPPAISIAAVPKKKLLETSPRRSNEDHVLYLARPVGYGYGIKRLALAS
jgi:hypothetical protein